jgi:hypothetical protein
MFMGLLDPDPHVFGPPGSGSISQRYGFGSGSISQRYGFGSGSESVKPGAYDMVRLNV